MSLMTLFLSIFPLSILSFFFPGRQLTSRGWRSNSQSLEGDVDPPGKRQALPIMAMGSCPCGMLVTLSVSAVAEGCAAHACGGLLYAE